MARIETTLGIVLRNFKYSETSIICDILTQDKGKISFIANGVRKKKSKLPYAYFQSFNILEITYYPSKNGLHRIKNVSPSPLLEELNFDVIKSSIALFLSEIIINTTRSNEKEEDLYHFLSQFIPYLDTATKSNITNIHLWATIRLMQFNGISPGNNYDKNRIYFNPIEGQFDNTINHKLTYNKETSYLFHQLLTSSLDNISDIHLSRVKRQEILQLMIQYFSIHIDGFKTGKTMDILSYIFEV